MKSEQFDDLSLPEDTQYPADILKQFKEYNPDAAGKKLKHKYSVTVYKSHFNEEMYELTEDYEFNVHKRKADTMNQQFVRDFFANSPLYDPEVAIEA